MSTPPASVDDVRRDVTAILTDMTRDWDTTFDGGISDQTRLIADLNFESIDVVQLITAIEEHYGRRDFAFEQLLMEGGRYVDEVTVGRIVEFLHRQLNR